MTHVDQYGLELARHPSGAGSPHGQGDTAANQGIHALEHSALAKAEAMLDQTVNPL